MKLYTKRGDKGTTSILGEKNISKDDLRIEAYGTVDELNTYLGECAYLSTGELSEQILSIQNLLFEIGMDLASKEPLEKISSSDTQLIEQWIDASENNLPELRSFILPGGSPLALAFHKARVICRRCERRIVTLSKLIEVSTEILPFINRLSDLLFSWARTANLDSAVEETIWETRG